MEFLQSVWAWLLASGLVWYVASALINFVLAHKSQIDGWAEANPKAAGILKILRSIGFDPWLLIQGISLLVTKRLPKNIKSFQAPPTGPVA